MQITETGLATVANVENNVTSSSCKGSDTVQDHSSQLDTHMAEPSPSSSGANNGSTVITTNESISAVLLSESSEVFQDSLQDDINNQNFNQKLSEVDTGGDCFDINGAVVGILEHADTTSVENLSIVTVVEKELEIDQETTSNTNNMDNLNGHCKPFFH